MVLRYKSHYIIFQSFRAFFALIIFIVFLIPTPVYRDEGKLKIVPGKNATVSGAVFDIKKHFCNVPDVDIVADTRSVHKTLNLSMDSKISDDLMKFARCRLKMERSKKPLDSCMCYIRYGYLVLLFFSLISFIVGVCSISFAWKQETWKPGFPFLLTAIFSSVCWLIVGSLATVAHYRPHYSYSTPNDIKGPTPYFAKPFIWSMALGFALGLMLLCIVETIYMFSVTSDVDPEEQEEAEIKPRSLKKRAD